ncbi:hypothetical protein NQ318_015983 [Aromia moschata]|uniref:Uncharacterized protein n=1 Tax=Aromia moschata TaxID=1265417 RepID=A0AAV8X1N0_9CUCU|nr:hypothetical protein NQ318_015983 [Aromia moschata]
MAQPSVANYFNNRKRSAVEETKINRAKKVLLLETSDLSLKQNGLGVEGRIIVPRNQSDEDTLQKGRHNKLQEKEENTVLANKIVITNTNVTEKSVSKNIRIARHKKRTDVANNQDIQQLFKKMIKKEEVPSQTIIEPTDQTNDCERHVTPPRTLIVNAMDKIKEKPDGPSLKEIKRKMTRSARLAELKASIGRFQEGANKLREAEKRTTTDYSSPKLKDFKTN